MGGKYRLGRKIGSGSFGDIYLGECTSLCMSLSVKAGKCGEGKVHVHVPLCVCVCMKELSLLSLVLHLLFLYVCVLHRVFRFVVYIGSMYYHRR